MVPLSTVGGLVFGALLVRMVDPPRSTPGPKDGGGSSDEGPEEPLEKWRRRKAELLAQAENVGHNFAVAFVFSHSKR
jgi:hypothetical protein